MTTRTFEDSPAVRANTPVLLGLMGPSGGGKTYSALRLATGIQRVSGGEIFVIDTEAKRALHYADRFKFRHVPFGAPFSPLDYLDAINHCVKKGAKTIVIDSMSHEHEGPGGVLEMFQAEFVRRGERDAVKLLCWAEPKRQRRLLINSILQMECNVLFCFRAKEKIKPADKGAPTKDLVDLGYMPIAAEEMLFEMMANFLLLPRANGVPTWDGLKRGEEFMTKMPEQFRDMFARHKQLNEDLGAEIATWAAGGTKPAASAPPVDNEARINKWVAWANKNNVDMATVLGDMGITSIYEAKDEHWKQLTAYAANLAKKAKP